MKFQIMILCFSRRPNTARWISVGRTRLVVSETIGHSARSATRWKWTQRRRPTIRRSPRWPTWPRHRRHRPVGSETTKSFSSLDRSTRTARDDHFRAQDETREKSCNNITIFRVYIIYYYVDRLGFLAHVADGRVPQQYNIPIWLYIHKIYTTLIIINYNYILFI